MTTDTADRTTRTDGADTWAVLLPPGRYEAERLVHHDTLELIGAEGSQPRLGDQVAVLADAPSRLVALGRVTDVGDLCPEEPPAERVEPRLVITYTRRSFDTPVSADALTVEGPVTPLDPTAFQALADQLGPPPPRQSWMVSLNLPIEAVSPAEAVREFWAYVQELGPRELPAFVWPSGNELAMQAFVLGEEANQDPEEDD
ncbi:hypothetical protein [Salinispora tropica]|uniref:Uncharacterized protein n=1 Tax=Salinispora tropica (strain ATCC BAA-916 / DSM 44818 / JCM 13857 / NBRC 105044 / CNB-440) TaxID=369723 RepID=A4X2T3_SALTO|nr:hypothetical protein [Salinispora tropica]ABP53183.1 hypothetical protein Strop_0706 [Salinispora tropica CNB-440]